MQEMSWKMIAIEEETKYPIHMGTIGSDCFKISNGKSGKNEKKNEKEPVCNFSDLCIVCNVSVIRTGCR